MVLGEVHWLHGRSSKVFQEKHFRWNFYLILSLLNPLTLLILFMKGNFLYCSSFFTFGIGSVTLICVGAYFQLNSMANFIRLKLQSKNLHIKPISHLVLKTPKGIYQKITDSCDDINLCFGVQ